MNNIDWTGNSRSIYTTLGASNHSLGERQQEDYYATEPKALTVLVNEGGVLLRNPILECACGEGHLSKTLINMGYDVVSRDLIDRGYGECGIDFLKSNETWDGTILTNPPYKYAQEFVEKALEIITPGNKVLMFLKLQFLEGKARRKLFDTKQLKTVYVSSSRLICAKNGEFEKYPSSAVAYAWFEFEKGYSGDAVIKWIN